MTENETKMKDKEFAFKEIKFENLSGQICESA